MTWRTGHGVSFNLARTATAYQAFWFVMTWTFLGPPANSLPRTSPWHSTAAGGSLLPAARACLVLLLALISPVAGTSGNFGAVARMPHYLPLRPAHYAHWLACSDSVLCWLWMDGREDGHDCQLLSTSSAERTTLG